jgi:uncharacterized protein
MRKYLVFILMLVAGAVFAAEAASPGVISVSGTGEVSAKPDMAVINAGVTTEDAQASACYAANSKIMNAVYAELKKAGIAEDDIKTVNFTLSPRINYNRKPGEPEKIVGYTLNHIFSIKVKDIKKAGDVIDRVVKAGATNVSNVMFTILDDTKYKAQAREEAVREAKEKAEQLAKTAGVTLDKIVSISESGSRPIYPLRADGMLMKAMAAEAAPVMEGELQITDTVQISYTIKQ